MIDFWRGRREKKRKGGIDIGSWNIFPRESKMINRIENRRVIDMWENL